VKIEEAQHVPSINHENEPRKDEQTTATPPVGEPHDAGASVMNASQSIGTQMAEETRRRQIVFPIPSGIG